MKPCPLKFHLHQASGDEIVITPNKGRVQAGSERAISVRRTTWCLNADVHWWCATAFRSVCVCECWHVGGECLVFGVHTVRKLHWNPAESESGIHCFKEINTIWCTLISWACTETWNHEPNFTDPWVYPFIGLFVPLAQPVGFRWLWGNLSSLSSGPSSCSSDPPQ